MPVAAGVAGLGSRDGGCHGGQPDAAPPEVGIRPRSGGTDPRRARSCRRGVAARGPERTARQPGVPAVRHLAADRRRVRADDRRSAPGHAAPLVGSRDRCRRGHVLLRAVHPRAQLRRPARRDRVPAPPAVRRRPRDGVGVAEPGVPGADRVPVVPRLRAGRLDRDRRVAEPRQRGAGGNLRESRLRAVRASSPPPADQRVRHLGARASRADRQLGGGRGRHRGDRPSGPPGTDRGAHVVEAGPARRGSHGGARRGLVRHERRPVAEPRADGAGGRRADGARYTDRCAAGRAVPPRRRADARRARARAPASSSGTRRGSGSTPRRPTRPRCARWRRTPAPTSRSATS